MTEDSTVKNLIKGITSDHDLIELADRINVKLDNIFDISEIKKPLPKGTFLILMRSTPGVGHWTIYDNNFYFDSFGVGPPSVLGDVKYNKKQYQSFDREYCGIWCLYFLYCRQKNKMHLLDAFVDLNDKTFE